LRPADKEALEKSLAEMVRSDQWLALLKERGWVDMYQSGEEFAAFLGPERARIEGILRDVGLIQ
jgi:tripartite-type tricarboxylate transporter receptor subunit TctC